VGPQEWAWRGRAAAAAGRRRSLCCRRACWAVPSPGTGPSRGPATHAPHVVAALHEAGGNVVHLVADGKVDELEGLGGRQGWVWGWWG
jgi:hypothetical protein